MNVKPPSHSKSLDYKERTAFLKLDKRSLDYKEHTAFLKLDKRRENGMKCIKKNPQSSSCSTSSLNSCKGVTTSNMSNSFVTHLIKYASCPLRFY